MNKNKLVLYTKKWLPAIVIALFIYWLSSQTGPEIKAAGLGSDSIHIVGHFWMFFVLCAAFYRATQNPLFSVLLSFVYALTDEYHQSFIFGRSASMSDIINDTLAATVVGLILWRFYPKLPKILKDLLRA